MNNKHSMWVAVALAATLALTSLHADARRLGGGKSMGQQSSNVTQRQATNPATAPATQAAPAAAPGVQAQRPGVPAAAAAPKRNWGGMLGGIAAGLGLAWLAHSLGMGEAFGSVLTVLLFVVLAVVAFRLLTRRRAEPAMAGASAGAPAQEALRAYNPKNVGNDASARPWEQSRYTAGTSGEAGDTGRLGAGGSMIGSALRGGAASWSVPQGFDAAGFVEAAKANFVMLQRAWDKGDVATLRAMMTDDMLAEVRTQLAEREGAAGTDQTEVLALQGELLGIEDRGHEYLASVEFSGMIREDASAGPHPFREVWNMSKSKSAGSGWLVAGLQALQ